MYIYQIYKTQKDIKNDVAKSNLKVNYIFSYKNSLYQMKNAVKYERLSEITFKNNYEKQHIEKMCSLVYQPGDIIYIKDKEIDE